MCGLFQIIVSGHEGVAVPTDFDEKAVYVIDGPDGISQVVASAEELQVVFKANRFINPYLFLIYRVPLLFLLSI